MQSGFLVWFRQIVYFCTLNPIMMRKTTLSIISVFACALFIACTSQPKTTAEKIDTLKQQVLTDRQSLQGLEDKDFAQLQKDFVLCDSLLQHLSQKQVDASFEQLNLTQAYLLQFKEVKPVMNKKMEYVVQQLDNLKSDAESHYLSDSLALIYLETETKVADTIHAQVEYFQDRFKSCQKSLNNLKKSNLKR